MDPQQTNANLSTTPKTRVLLNFFKSRMGKIVTISLCLVLLLFLVFIASKRTKKTNKTPTFSSSFAPDQIIARVGQENIYQKDLNNELKNYPLNSSAGDIRKEAIKKLVSDSVTIQAGLQEGLVAKNPDIFNSPQKDYNKRIEAVQQIQKEVADSLSIKGAVVGIWFFNTTPPPQGIENAQKIAFSKINYLYRMVKSGIMTPKQAGEMIKNDSSLAGVDPSYKSNAYFEFSVPYGKSITFDSGFDKILYGLKKGEISGIYLAKDKNLATGQMVDALYMFGQVTQTKTPGSLKGFADWYQQEEKKYAVKFY